MELAEVNPKLEKAMQSVKGIQARELATVKGMNNPPAKIKLCMNAIICCIKNL